MRILIAITTAVFLPLAALMIVLLTPACQVLADATVGPVDHEYLVGIAMAVRDFSIGNDAAALPLGSDYHTAMTPDAIQHLLDVRVVFIACEVAAVVLCVALATLCTLVVRKHGVRRLSRPLLIGGAAPLVAAGILGLAVAIDFTAFFTWMHGLLFAAGTWTFPADSLLIRALPTDFWISCAVVWAACTALFCVIAVVAGLVLNRTPRSARVSAPVPLEKGH